MGQANNTQAARSALIVVRAGGQQNESSNECSPPAAQLHVINSLSTWQLQRRGKERCSPSPPSRCKGAPHTCRSPTSHP